MRALLAGALLVALAGPTVAGQIPKYDRKEWKHWITSPTNPCRNVREEALLRDRQSPNDSGVECTVLPGEWRDPYTDKVYTNPTDLDIDHVVPLENAHISGGWRWSAERKKAYANNLQYRWHLLAVYDKANQAKGSKPPDRWVPENEAFHCRYGEIWATIKFVENLSSTQAERDAVRELVSRCR